MRRFSIWSVTPLLISLHNIPPPQKKLRHETHIGGGGGWICILSSRDEPEDKKINLLSSKYEN